ncbi:hypothetical protein DFJ73DRAFT_854886 [Zopfochytrium polystomum]|nr:hypothetical protein DFJ73DRAFT_854886 [Zopfochytrium polystomum]
MWGFQMDWDSDGPAQLVARLGGDGTGPAVVGAALPINSTYTPTTALLSLATRTVASSAATSTNTTTSASPSSSSSPPSSSFVLSVTLTPTDDSGVGAVTNASLWNFAMALRKVNVEMGVPVLLTYCPHMNDRWQPVYGMRPSAMLTSFKTLSAYVRYAAPMTAMVWSPALGTDYPFFGGRFAPAAAWYGYEDLTLLDTDGDGAITSRDDAYR